MPADPPPLPPKPSLEGAGLVPPDPKQPQLELAPLHIRGVAFLLDMLLVAALSIFICSRFVIPGEHSDAAKELVEQFQAYEKAVEESIAQEAPMPETPVFSDAIGLLISDVWSTSMLICWCYLLISDMILRGSSLGKRVFNIRAVDMDTGEVNRGFGGAMRPLAKTLILFGAILLFPLIFSYLLPFFNKKRRAGHDYICRTVVAYDPV